MKKQTKNSFSRVTQKLSLLLRKHERLLVLSLLCLLFLQATLSMRLKSSVCDEHAAHIVSGYLYLRSGQFSGGLNNPPLIQLLIALPLKLFHLEYEFFSDRYLFYARLPIVFLSLLLGYCVYKWAKDAYGWKAGLFALTLYSFSPNILAHSRLATVDLGASCFMFIATYFLWKAVNQPSTKNLLLTSLTFALAQLSKFSCIYLALIFVVLALILLLFQKDVLLWQKFGYEEKILKKFMIIVVSGLVVLIVTVLVINLGYRFQELSGILPLKFLNGIKGKLSHSQKGHFAFLMGNRTREGWWYYYIVAFMVKTPLPLVFLIALRLFLRKWREKSYQVSHYLLVPVILLFSLASYARVNIGIRHVLPIYPFLFVWISGIVNYRVKKLFWGLVILSGWFIISSLSIFPHYLAYFSELIGGARNGYKYLIDSNLDWGQDDKLLKQYLMNKDDIRVNPKEDIPIVGKVVVNANSLQNIMRMDNKRYFWLRLLEPVDNVGYSWLVYDPKLSDYEDYVEEHPSDPYGYMYLGIIHRSIKNKNEAIKNFRKAIEMDPQVSSTYIEFARLYLEENLLDSSIVILKDAIRHNPQDPEIHLELKLITSRKLIQQDSSNAEAYLNLGRVWINKGNLDTAFAYVSHAIRIDQELARAYLCLGQIYGKNGDFGKAVEYISKAIASDKQLQKKGAKMIKIFSQYSNVKRHKNDSKARYLMALWERDNGRYKEAVIELKKAIELDPTFQPALWALGNIFVQTKLRTIDTGLEN